MIQTPAHDQSPALRLGDVFLNGRPLKPKGNSSSATGYFEPVQSDLAAAPAFGIHFHYEHT